MVQRLGLAVAMLPAAPVVLLDEPTAALDAEGLRGFYELVEERRAAGAAVLFTSHQITDVERLADRVVVMVRGRIVADLTREAFTAWLDECGVVRLRTTDRGRPLDIYETLVSNGREPRT
jgi:Cu-processing system ATP-binding protein